MNFEPESFQPGTNFSVQFRGDYEPGSKGRKRTKGDNWQCKCVNCGEIFPTRVDMRNHYKICQHFENNQNEIKRKQDEDVIVLDDDDTDVKQEQCTEASEAQMQSLGQNKLQTVIISDVTTAEDYTGVAVSKLGHQSALSSDCENSETNNNEIATLKLVQDSVKLRTQQLLEMSINKRSIEESQPQPTEKRTKLEKTSNWHSLSTLFAEDVNQAKLLQKLDRRGNDRPYKCPICYTRYKFKNKYDFHVKYAHADRSTGGWKDPTRTFSHPAFGQLDEEEQARKKTRMHTKVAASQPDVMSEPKHIAKPTWVSEPKHIEEYTKWIKPEANRSPERKQSPENGIVKGSNYRCFSCNMTFRYQSRLGRHTKVCQAGQQKNAEFWSTFNCAECETTVSNRFDLLIHYKKHHWRELPASPAARDHSEGNKDDVTKEHSNYNINVGDIMNHLRSNLICLRDDKLMNLAKENEDSNLEKIGIKAEQTGCPVTVPVQAVRVPGIEDESTGYSAAVPVKIFRNIAHTVDYAHTGSTAYRKFSAGISTHSSLKDEPNYSELPLDLSIKSDVLDLSTKSTFKEESVKTSILLEDADRRPDGTRPKEGEENVKHLIRKPILQERQFLYQYYTDFITEQT